MEYSLFFNVKIFIAILLLFVFVGCDRYCDDGDCPTDQISIEFEVVDSLNRNCANINPDFEAIILSSNNLNQDEVVTLRNGNLRLNIQSNITEYLLKYNQTDLITLDLEAERMTVTCCDSNIDVLVEYELIHRNANDTICTNCFVFQLMIPSCD